MMRVFPQFPQTMATLGKTFPPRTEAPGVSATESDTNPSANIQLLCWHITQFDGCVLAFKTSTIRAE
jgi:hypothetical protein